MRYFTREHKDWGSWVMDKDRCQATGSAHDEMEDISPVAVYVFKDAPTKMETDYYRYTELTEEEAFALAGKNEKYNTPIITRELSPVLYFFTEKAAASLLGQQRFLEALAHGEEDAERYAE